MRIKVMTVKMFDVMHFEKCLIYFSNWFIFEE